ncbi:MAG: adenosine kinase [Cyclobacteriaceae bacterium]
MKKYDVYAIGNAMVDYEIEVDDQFLGDHAVEKGFMTLVDDARQHELLEAAQQKIRKKQGGGSAANTIMAVSQLGGKAYYACKVANDNDGQLYLKDLHDHGIDTNLSNESLFNGVTGKCLVMVSPDAERTMNTYLGITADFSVKELDTKAIASSEYLFIEGYLVSSETGFEAMKEAKRIAAENNVKVSLTFSDPSMVKYFRGQMSEIVGSGVDLLFCNEEEAQLFTEKDSTEEAKEALKEVAQTFVITRGDKGALVWDGQTFIVIPPFETSAVDTTGAGDMYSGAFLFGITNGHSFAKSGLLASKSSSAVVSKYGPRLDKDQLKQFAIEIL